MRSALKKQAKKAIEELSEEKVKVAVDFLEYLRDKEEIEATLEILGSSELRSQLEEADRAIEQGRLSEFIPWEKARRNV
jgi:hypothetical protein